MAQLKLQAHFSQNIIYFQNNVRFLSRTAAFMDSRRVVLTDGHCPVLCKCIVYEILFFECIMVTWSIRMVKAVLT